MNSPVAHWGTREWRKSQDELARDPQRPQAFPSKCPMDLMGRIQVRLTTEDGDLVAYGFGGQRIAVPAKSVGEVHTVNSFRTGAARHGRALLVLDRERRILLRASGRWETYGEIAAVCRAAKVPAPTHLVATLKPRSAGRSGSGAPGRPSARSARRGTTLIPRFSKAPGYRRLRTNPRGTTLRVLAQAVLFAATISLGVFAGVLPAVALPESVGAVRTLIGIAGVTLGAAAGIWLGAAISHVLADAVRWAATSWAVRTPAPARRFFGRRRERCETWLAAANVGLAALVLALIGWGPGVGIASLVHGLRDSSLVAELRADGAMAQGTLVDVQQTSTDSDGNTTVTDVPTLSFLGHQATDPSIGGRPLPLDSADPASTRVPETVVYLPSDPQVAAAEQQLDGSVWHGAPTANLITGGLFTLALPPLLWLLVLRVRRRRWRRAREFVADLA